jgi:hypothetical protein
MAAFSIPQIHHAPCSVCRRAELPLAGYMDLVGLTHAFRAWFIVPSRYRKSLAQLAEATTILCAYCTLLAATCRVGPYSAVCVEISDSPCVFSALFSGTRCVQVHSAVCA